MARRVRKVGMTVRRGSDLENWAKDAKKIRVVKKDGEPIKVVPLNDIVSVEGDEEGLTW